MNAIFVDTLYLVALYNPKDQWHDRSLAVGKQLPQVKLITTEEVLVELLNFFSEHGERARKGVVAQVDVLSNLDRARSAHAM